MKQVSPSWWQYVLAQRPFVIHYSPDLGQKGYAGSGGCCYGTLSNTNVGALSPTKVGRIDFAGRPPDDPTKDLWFLVTLAHEVTHVRDLRVGRFVNIADSRIACRATERSAVDVERSDLVDLSNSRLKSQFNPTVDDTIRGVDDVLARGTFDWAPACR
jgi:hypothetical protein